LADARLALQVAPLVGRPVTAREVLGWATSGSASGLGRPELGVLTAGAAADLVCWDVTGVADAGGTDPLGGLVWRSPGRRARHVVVAGRVVVRDGGLVARPEREIGGQLRALLASRAGA
jgi:cytosine/adenosine deaminase-related metal-dependent hydrolase